MLKRRHTYQSLGNASNTPTPYQYKIEKIRDMRDCRNSRQDTGDGRFHNRQHHTQGGNG